MYKSKNTLLCLFNIHKYSAWEVKASLSPLSLAPFFVGSSIITSTETEEGEHLEQMEEYLQADKQNVRPLFT